MKIYDSKTAPNPRRARIFLAEKGVQVPYEEVDIVKADNRSAEFRKKNPLGVLPVLELNDGTCIAESVAICRYFEETHPQPPLHRRHHRVVRHRLRSRDRHSHSGGAEEPGALARSGLDAPERESLSHSV